MRARGRRGLQASVGRMRGGGARLPLDCSPTAPPRSCVQDRLVACSRPWPAATAAERLHLFAVFDGHHGEGAAEYAAQHAGGLLDALLPAGGAPADERELQWVLQEAVVRLFVELHRCFALRGEGGGTTAAVVVQVGLGSAGGHDCSWVLHARANPGINCHSTLLLPPTAHLCRWGAC